MAGYAGATFEGMPEEVGWWVHWRREKTIVRRKLGGGNAEDIQDVGFGNWFVELPILIRDDVGVGILQAAVGLTKRTLSSFHGQTISNVMLTSFGRPTRTLEFAAWKVDVRFEYEAA